MSAEIRGIELVTAWAPFGENGSEQLMGARVTLRRNGQRRLSHEVFVAGTFPDALRALATAMDRGYPEKLLDEVTG